MGSYLFSIVLTVHVLVGIGVIGLVLLQHGKGADAGAAFGSGSSGGAFFGASGSANFMSRTTGVLATVFFITSLGLSYLASSARTVPASVMEQAVPAAGEAAPAPAAGSDSKLNTVPK